jgi:hypothetical protein
MILPNTDTLIQDFLLFVEVMHGPPGLPARGLDSGDTCMFVDTCAEQTALSDQHCSETRLHRYSIVPQEAGPRRGRGYLNSKTTRSHQKAPETTLTANDGAAGTHQLELHLSDVAQVLLTNCISVHNRCTVCRAAEIASQVPPRSCFMGRDYIGSIPEELPAGMF